MNRRKFIEASGAAAGAAVLGNLNNALAENQEGTKPAQGKYANIKLGFYSITYDVVRNEGAAPFFEEFCKRSKDYGFDEVELDNILPTYILLTWKSAGGMKC
jgi:hypothetical protein